MTELDDGGKVLQGGNPLGRDQRQRHQRAGVDMLDRCRQGDACEGNVVSQQVGHDRPAAAVWNVIECRQQPRLAQKLLDHEGAERGLPR
jgi:hypothetical protein